MTGSDSAPMSPQVTKLISFISVGDGLGTMCSGDDNQSWFNFHGLVLPPLLHTHTAMKMPALGTCTEGGVQMAPPPAQASCL